MLPSNHILSNPICSPSLYRELTTRLWLPTRLVSTFAGRELTRQAYREAIDREYRFYSYGDAMLVV